MQMKMVKMDLETQRTLSERLLTGEGRIRLFPAAEYHAVPHEDLLVWCHRTARYTLPTLELIDWLKEMIGTRSAIEVGAGNGDLGYHLGIVSTDSYCQQDPLLKMQYVLSGQVPTNPPDDVKRFTAEQAVRRFRPQVVVASWLTRKFVTGKDDIGKAQASVYGANEEEILKNCEMYIHIGNEGSHGEKTLLKKPHEIYRFDWLVTRAMNPMRNVIYVWRNR